ncbi:MAG: class I SAM-dependent methyltransferase, partial [Thermoprotei archaeon]
MEVWDKVFERGEFSLLEPQPEVVELIPILKKRKAMRILELGCGAGRNLILLAREGFHVYGVDISRIALK